ncbi:MAG: DUF2461 domain-containing protein, partial [Maribacter sp.]
MLHATITKSTLQFLERLKKNNDRDWFTEHKDAFKEEEDKVKEFFNSVLQKVAVHDEIERLKIFRIYRDVRFSKDKTPYKHNFSASLSRAGLHRRGGYYIHIQPQGSFIATGFWNPEKADLLRIRKEWELDTNELVAIIEKESFK